MAQEEDRGVMTVGVPDHVVESDLVRTPKVLDILGGVPVRRQMNIR